MKFVAYAIAAVAVAVLVATLVSFVPTDYWFVRSVDLVREPIAWVSLALLVLAGLALRGRARWIAIGGFGMAIILNLWRMAPYLPVSGTEIALGQPVEAERCFTALAVNVKVKNTGYAQIREQIERADPDVLLLMETDEAWVDALDSVIARYPHSQVHPQPEAFGMVFASRVPVTKSVMEENTHRDTPTLYATLQLAGSAPVEFIGLHPKPPLPGWNTEERDENIINAGIETPDRLPDAFVMGDFNDVPWSRTTTAFRERGGWRDPRVGRGAYPTFPSNTLWAGWPLDQLMVKGDVRIESWRVMPDNGSDHRAIFSEMCVRS